MTQVEIEQLILENGFKLESKEGHITYEFGTGDIYRISQLLFKKMDYIPCCKSDSEQLCECAMPDPINPWDSLDKDTCRKCENKIA